MALVMTAFSMVAILSVATILQLEKEAKKAHFAEESKRMNSKADQ